MLNTLAGRLNGRKTLFNYAHGRNVSANSTASRCACVDRDPILIRIKSRDAIFDVDYIGVMSIYKGEKGVQS